MQVEIKSVKQYTLAELADVLRYELQVDVKGDASCVISGISTLQDAVPGTLSFLANPAYAKYLADTKADAVLLTPEVAADYSGNALVMKNPYLGFARLSRLFERGDGEQVGVHADASVDESAVIAQTAWIGPGAVIEAGAHVEAGARVLANTVVGRDCVVGEGTILKANVTLCHGVTIGKRCIIHNGAVLGADGFGFANDAGSWVKIAQLGGVIVGDDVEIGANTTIDRGALDNTIIHDGVKLDNLVQIAHNVEIGRNTAIAACTGISGSTKIGSGCTIAGGSGIAGHLDIADGVHIAGMAMVTKSITDKGVWSSGGIGCMPVKEWRRNTVRFRQLDDMAKRIRRLEKQTSKGRAE
ncbi:UDP-3-O-(3-hydroxymyristoyl)glucosamine N-acyltransferase [Sansalvadorimonas verongulae]|uniref:UDP-3-O-(3-hydroxymyristoyl)glucosamine N-acyltransferase n=1 Tax=Sansalvadorimonas verongulae TaxID=2172824 RepID=UPI0012BCF3AA|nr:UDP-3-O-(3-hydroxymyristoyl)glucosamine N-acyltransferase [Sansalvadorimonas verongulae]MTI14253.1 UDP-3-O-(3-hydroxymyristoyl)glucosamine N-acyltransferase [Sansalvadorimonas verongulae]